MNKGNVLGLWSLNFELCTWNSVLGTLYLELCTWNSVLGTLYLELCTNSNPGFALKPWGNEQRHFVATLKELRHRWSAGSMGMATQLLQSCDLEKLTSMCPGLKQPLGWN